MDEIAARHHRSRKRAAPAVGRYWAMAMVLVTALAVPLMVSLFQAKAQAQVLPGCTTTRVTNPPRQVLDCGNGLLIESEAAAALTAQTPQSGLDLEGRAILIEVSPRESFQVLTPHAIATVRGTQFAVDVDAGVTSVFVVEGSVEVSRRDGPATVLLGPGEGVDVRPGEPLVVREWPQPRVNVLLARFGR